MFAKQTLPSTDGHIKQERQRPFQLHLHQKNTAPEEQCTGAREVTDVTGIPLPCIKMFTTRRYKPAL